jgi:hypothetical protein
MVATQQVSESGIRLVTDPGRPFNTPPPPQKKTNKNFRVLKSCVFFFGSIGTCQLFIEVYETMYIAHFDQTSLRIFDTLQIFDLDSEEKV